MISSLTATERPRTLETGLLRQISVFSVDRFHMHRGVQTCLGKSCGRGLGEAPITQRSSDIALDVSRFNASPTRRPHFTDRGLHISTRVRAYAYTPYYAPALGLITESWTRNHITFVLQRRSSILTLLRLASLPPPFPSCGRVSDA